MNIDTDTQYAFTRPVAGHFFSNYDGVLKVDGEVGNKKAYDPRAWGKLAEAGMAERVVEACEQLRSAGHLAQRLTLLPLSARRPSGADRRGLGLASRGQVHPSQWYRFKIFSPAGLAPEGRLASFRVGQAVSEVSGSQGCRSTMMCHSRLGGLGPGRFGAGAEAGLRFLGDHRH